MEKKVFRSRISVLLLVFILVIMLPPLFAIIRSGIINHPALYILVGTIVFIVFSGYCMRYEIAGDTLRIDMWGAYIMSCPISQIISIRRSYSPFTSQGAGSFKKLKIIKTGFPYLISPVREQEFLDALKEINPNIFINVSNKKGWWRIWDWDI